MTNETLTDSIEDVVIKRFAKALSAIILFSILYGSTASTVKAQWAYSGNDIYNTNTGSVGIGTANPTAINPTAKLGLDSTGNTYLTINAPLAYQSGFAFGDQTNGQDIAIYRPADSRDLAFWTATYPSGIVMKLTQGGNLGIGTISPSTQLHTTGGVRFAGITADTQTDAVMVDSSGNLSKRVLNTVAFNGETDPVWMAAKSSAQTISGGWTFNTNPTTFSGADISLPGNGVWKSSGDVGIGTTTPTQKLDVNGAIRIGDGGTKPTCDATQRGTIWMDFGDAGMKDTVQICAKNNAGAYNWRNIY